MTEYILRQNGVGYSAIVLMVELIIEAAFLIALHKTKNKKWPIEKKFLLMAIPLGFMFIVLLPPGQSPDETNNFRRAYGIASGSILAEKTEAGGGSELPNGIKEALVIEPEHGVYGALAEKAGTAVSTEKSLQRYANTAIYNFISYLPQVLAALIGKLFSLSILITAYLMEIFNFTIWLIVIYFAIKFMPKLKTIILFIALSPMTLQEATSLTTSGLTIGLALLLIAFVCYLAYGKKGTMNKKELTILYALAALIGLFKIIYAPLVLLFFLIPYERLGSKKQKWMHAGIMAGIFLIINISWLLVSFSLETVLQPGVDSSAQAIWILKHPLSYLMRVIATTDTYGINWIADTLGLHLGAFNMMLPNIYYPIVFGFFILLVFQRHEAIKLKAVDRIVFGSVLAIIIALLYVSEYLQWTAYGANIIEGIQGRYFLPILPLLPLAIARKSDKLPHMELITEDKVIYYGLFINLIAFATFFARNI